MHVIGVAAVQPALQVANRPSVGGHLVAESQGGQGHGRALRIGIVALEISRWHVGHKLQAPMRTQDGLSREHVLRIPSVS